MTLRELDVVRVVRLQVANRPFDGTAPVMRAPRIGDVGTVCAVADAGPWFVVEMVDGQGSTIWLADFHRDELAAVHTFGADADALNQSPPGAPRNSRVGFVALGLVLVGLPFALGPGFVLIAGGMFVAFAMVLTDWRDDRRVSRPAIWALLLPIAWGLLLCGLAHLTHG